jgi:hypothetical protein
MHKPLVHVPTNSGQVSIRLAAPQRCWPFAGPRLPKLTGPQGGTLRLCPGVPRTLPCFLPPGYCGRPFRVNEGSGGAYWSLYPRHPTPCASRPAAAGLSYPSTLPFPGTPLWLERHWIAIAVAASFRAARRLASFLYIVATCFLAGSGLVRGHHYVAMLLGRQ